MSFKRALLKFATYLKYQSFVKDTNNPKKVQQQLWQKEILPLLKQSPFWQTKYDLNKIYTLDNFEITNYQDYQPGLEQAMSATIQPFNGEDILFWSETSASTGKRKYFPITKSFQKQFQRTMPPYFYSLLARFPNFLSKKVVYLAAWDTKTYTDAGIKKGLISNYNYNHLPGLIKSFYAVPAEIFRDEQTFKQWAPVYALAADLSALFAIVPTSIADFYQQCVNGFNHYLPYLLEEKPLPQDLPKLSITKTRQQHLLSLGENKNYQDLWPSLSFVGCWIEGPCQAFAKELSKSMTDKITMVDGTYSATEGWLTVPIQQTHKGGVLHPRTHIVEFIEYGKDIKKAHLLQSWQLEIGKKYEVFLTTAMGFVRYRLKDIIECTGYFNKAPIIAFYYKASLLLMDYCTLSESELSQAAQAADIEMQPYWYFACDQYRNRLFLVVDEQAAINNKQLEDIDQYLRSANEKYDVEYQQGNVLACQLIRKNKQLLTENHHAQTKPKMISQQILSP